MDDTDDKARRNLVLAASVICMCALAGLPLEVVVDRLLGVGHAAYKGLKVSPVRLWLCVLLVLAYLATRYRFAEETTTQIANAKLEWARLLADGCEREVRAALRRLSRTGLDTSVFVESIARTQGAVFETPGLHTARGEGFEHIEAYRGRVGVDWSSADRRQSSSGHMHEFYITGWRRARVRVNATGFLLIHSRTALQVVIPSVLAAVPCTIAAWNIGLALLA